MRAALLTALCLLVAACSSAPPAAPPEAPAPVAPSSPPAPTEPVEAEPPPPQPPEAPRFSADLLARATAIARDAIIVDGHIDVPYRLWNRPDDVGEATASGDFDYPRAVAGGLDAPFMSIYIPARYQETGGATALADSLIDMMEGIVDQHPEKFRIATSVADVRANRRAGLMSLPLGMENGAPVEGDLANLEHFHARGIRYITLAHSRDNEISDSSYDGTGTHDGLSDFGREVVREMNRLGIIVDISHVSDAAFDDVMEVTAAPVIASHSSARHFTPGFERNLDDDRIRALASGGGVFMINFGSSFLSDDYRQRYTRVLDAFAAELEADGIEPGSDEGRQRRAAVIRERIGYADLDDVLNHIDHVRDLA
ncbi:MAG: membrane dipeptidase [Bacteroidota bacterium]